MLFGVSFLLGSLLGWKLAGWLMLRTNFSSLLWVLKNPHLCILLCLSAISWDQFLSSPASWGRYQGWGQDEGRRTCAHHIVSKSRFSTILHFPLPFYLLSWKKTNKPVLSLCGTRAMGKVGHRGRNSSEFSLLSCPQWRWIRRNQKRIYVSVYSDKNTFVICLA